MKKTLLWILAALTLLSLAACGEKTEPSAKSPGAGISEASPEPAPQEDEATPEPIPQETEPAPAAPTLVVGKDVNEDDMGQGPVYLESRYGTVYIPEGLTYEVFNVPETVEISAHDSFELKLGADGSSGGGMFIVASRRVTSLEDCVESCISVNNYGGAREDTVEEGTLRFGGLDFKSITLQRPDGSSVDHYLVAYYETGGDAGGYIEYHDYEHGWSEALRIDDPLVAQILEESVFK